MPGQKQDRFFRRTSGFLKMDKVGKRCLKMDKESPEV